MTNAGTPCAESAQELLDFWRDREVEELASRDAGAVPGMGSYRHPRNASKSRQDAPRSGESAEAYAQRRLWGAPVVEDTPQARRRREIAEASTYREWLALADKTYQQAFGKPVPKGGWGALTKAWKLLKGEFSEGKAKELFLWTITRLGREGSDQTPTKRVMAYCQELSEMGRRRKALRYYESLPLVGPWNSVEDTNG